MIEDVISEGNQIPPRVTSNKAGRNLHLAQENIYRFLTHLVKQRHPETALLEFKRLFIDYTDTVDPEPLLALGEIIFENDEELFRSTLKRCCYILINNWESSRHYGYTGELVKIFSSFKSDKDTLRSNSSRLRRWLLDFVNSEDYQQLQLFGFKYEGDEGYVWAHRYTSYLLVPQYVNLNNPVEQREAARNLSQQLKNRFKFELAIYTARSQSAISKDKMPKNPTCLGDDVLRLIKTIVAKRGALSYTNLANIFLKQTENLDYKKFKQSLQRYLFFSVGNKQFVETLNEKLSLKLDNLYKVHNEEILDDNLMLKTCSRVIEYLTSENYQEPSSIFILFMEQGNPLTLIVILLKIILVCKNARTHLENCIAVLIQHYKNYPEADCKWVINFCEMFNITFAIYAENVQYNLIKVKGDASDKPDGSLDAYRVFAQLKWDSNSEFTPEAMRERFVEQHSTLDE